MTSMDMIVYSIVTYIGDVYLRLFTLIESLLF